MYWEQGIMHHEDVLYFALYIIKKRPRVLEFVRNKYPYIFIDEFQDTSNLQAKITQKLGQGHVTLGVIGDLAQSIYKFAGANRSDFENLDIQGMTSYKLDRNYRSTKNIVTFLNSLRTDITQHAADDAQDGERVTILIGTPDACYDDGIKTSKNDLVWMAMSNEEVLNLKSDVANDKDLLKEMYDADSNSKRANFIHQMLAGFQWCKSMKKSHGVKVATQQLTHLNPNLASSTARTAAIYVLEYIKNSQIIDVYSNIKNILNRQFGILCGAKITGGKPKTFYTEHTIGDLLKFIKVDVRSENMIRTIHSSKGTEFDNVMVQLKSSKDITDYIIDAKNNLYADSDTGRIYYVAFSRAKQRLFISVPNLSKKQESDLERLGLCIKRLTEISLI